MSSFGYIGQLPTTYQAGVVSCQAWGVGAEPARATDNARNQPSTGDNSQQTRPFVEHGTCERLSTVETEPSDADILAAIRGGDTERFGELVTRYQARLFATARRHSRHENEVEDIVQEIFLKAFHRLGGFRGEAPFEHWLMRLAIHTCYDFLRRHQRNREHPITELSDDERDWLETQSEGSELPGGYSGAAKTLIDKVLERMSAPNRLIITLLEIEDRSVKEVAALTGWSVTLVKVRAFRARAEMRRIIQRMTTTKYL